MFNLAPHPRISGSGKIGTYAVSSLGVKTLLKLAKQVWIYLFQAKIKIPFKVKGCALHVCCQLQ
uniref:Uncharacterized protein n=1 Tax=Arundo donax TaxID=35708 RepID=A0A0A9BED1_ARUDO